MAARQIDTSIDVYRWLEAAEEEIGYVDGVLGTLTIETTKDGLEVYELRDLDDDALVEYLKDLAVKLRVVARNLDHLADHADLTGLVGDLKSVRYP